jgi:hypothetical protein
MVQQKRSAANRRERKVKIRVPKITSAIAISAAVALMTACGGGGDSETPVAEGPSAEGVYGGTITGGTNTAFQLLVLENGEYWSIYGVQSANVFGIAGFLQGTGTSASGSFTSTSGKDFGFSPAIAVSVNSNYDATAKTVAGTITSPGGSTRFSGGPIAGSLYNYNSAASLSTIAGSWTTSSITGEQVVLSIATNGAFTATSSLGCAFSGTVVPRASGKNVFNVSLRFGAAPCELAGQSATGIGVAYPLANGTTQLVVAAVDSTRSYGAAVFGTR